MKRVLIVTPNWPPVNCPDLHRVRMAMPYFNEFGWEPLILKINPHEQEGVKDFMLCRSIPDSVHTRQAECVPLKLTEWCGIRNIGIRSHVHLGVAGSQMIREFRPAVAFFSTTMFSVMTLGRYWREKHGLPYVLDFQDPWFSNGLLKRDRKHALSQLLAKYLEPFTLRRSSHVVSVSPTYPQQLCGRYSWLHPYQFTVLPFGASTRDFELLHELAVSQNVFNPKDGKQHWVYVGAGGPAMSFALRSLFKALKRLADVRPMLRNELRLHFIGTDYAPVERATKTVEPLAVEAGLDDMVTEQTGRLPYFEALQCLVDADALMIVGSNDEGYTPSKLFPYILAGRPLLAILHAQSSAVEVMDRTRAGTVISFGRGDTLDTVAERLLATGWLNAPPPPGTDWSQLAPYSARAMTDRLCQILERATRQ